MPLLSFSCLPCSTSSAAEKPSPILTADDPIHLTMSSTDTISSSSASSSATSTASSSAADDAISIQTFPSLPTLHAFFPSQTDPAPLSATSSLISSLNPTPPSSHPAPALALSSNLLFSFSQTSIAVYDLTDLRQLLSVPSLSSAGSIKSVTISPHAVTLFTAHQDGKIRAWSSKTPKIRLLSSLPTLRDRLRLLPLPSNYVAVRRHRKRLWIEHADAVSALAVAGGLLYSVSWDKTLKIWRISDLKCLESVTAHDDAINAVAVGPDGIVYTGSADKKIKVWGKESGHRRHVLLASLVRHKSVVNALAVSSDGNVLYSGACDRSILVWEREESANFMSCTGALRGHVRAIIALSAVGDDLVVSGSTDRTVRVWRRGGGPRDGYSCLCVLEGHVRGVRSVVAAREEGEEEEEAYRVCSGSVDGEVRVWRVRVEKQRTSNKE